MEAYSKCPCGGESGYDECCGRFLDGGQRPETAEQLMRSRYTAYCRKRVDYLFDTTHPQAREPRLREGIQETADDCEWLSLAVLGARQGQADDKIGKVEFRAEFRYQGRTQTHHEHSRFRRFEGRWMYLDGEG